MSTFIFSDTHFTKRFNKKRFDKLTELINKADTVIINGDFWEGFTITFDEFLNSEWKKLFPLLKEKKAIYIYGNHDDKRLSDDRIYEFCEQDREEYILKTPKRNYFFTHGQNFLYPKLKDANEHLTARSLYKKFDIFIAGIIQNILFNVFGSHVFPKRFNKLTQEERAEIAPMDHLLVCGHSHTPEYNPDINFADIGFFNYGWANYMWIDDEGNFELRSERY